MNNDLLKQAREYLKQTEGITEGEWREIYYNYSFHNASGLGSWITINSKKEVPEKDVKAIALTPTAIRLIEELVKQVDKHKRRIASAKKFMKDLEGTNGVYLSLSDYALFGKDGSSRGFERAIEFMTEEE